jgi:hypothetical protein
MVLRRATLNLWRSDADLLVDVAEVGDAWLDDCFAAFREREGIMWPKWIGTFGRRSLNPRQGTPRRSSNV